jgi:hypothetical protein
MTTKEVKEYFRQIRKEQMEINHLIDMIRSEELMLLPKAIQYDKDKVQSSPEDVLSKKVAEIAELDAQWKNAVVNLKFRRARAEAMLNALESSDEREVMRWYYMSTNNKHLMTWDEVATKMSYNKRWILKIHGNAIMHLSENKMPD